MQISAWEKDGTHRSAPQKRIFTSLMIMGLRSLNAAELVMLSAGLGSSHPASWTYWPGFFWNGQKSFPFSG